ncbi:putative ribonuclease H-like domain-containing protein [Tanacetum coccineum]|uniref:Ribonuclease H-like domain-containing protein n=1 Tax=Tanacetum coccineum TaxID=301880 RepID=A0ABQ5B3L8_9ASTR
MTHPSPKRNMVPKAVLMRSGLVSLTTARPVNTAQPRTIVNSARPMTNVFNKAHSTVRRTINNKTTTKNSNFNQKVNTVRTKAVLNTVKGNHANAVMASTCWVWKPKNKVIDHVFKYNSASMIFKRYDYIDAQGRSNGCSRHMTWNMSYLIDFEEIDGGYVAFGGNSKGGKITGKGSRPNWLFDIDALTKSMNYKPVVVGNLSNGNAGTKTCDDAGKARMETIPGKDYILLPLWTADPPLSQSSKSSPDVGFKPLGDDEKKLTEEAGKEGGDPSKEGERDDQEKDYNVNSTNNVNVVGTNEVNTVGGKTSIELSDDPNMLALEDIVYSDDDEDVGADAYINNLDAFMPVNPIPTRRIHKDHPVKQIIGDLNSAPQTRRMTKNLEEYGFVEEPKKVIQALKDPSWIEAMQEELLQFRLQEVWTLVDLPNGERAIGTKWVFKNKKDERGIMIKNKARLVKTVNGEVQFQALVDGKKIIVTEAFVRRDLQLNDEEGTDYLPNATIFKELTRMRYEKLSQNLIFYKTFFSPQWKFLIHTILQCLSAKTTAWNEFSSTMVSVIIYLTTNQKFNFSKYIFESLVKNLENVSGNSEVSKLFVQVFLEKQLEGMSNHKRIYVTPSHTKKIFGNMRRVGKGFSRRETPLFPTMMVQAQEEMGEGLANPTDPHHTPTIIQPSTSQPQKKQKPRKPKRKDTEVPQPSGPTDNVADEAVYEEMDDSLERAATTATSLDAEQDRGNINKTQSKATLNEPSSLGTSSGSGPRRQETMGDTIAQTGFENVSKTSNDSLLAGVNTPRSDEDSLKLKELMELYAEITLVDETQGRYGDDLMFDTVSTADPVTTASVEVSTADDLTLAQTLIEIKSARPIAKGIVFREPDESTTTTRPQQQPIKDKAELEEEDRLVRQREEEANIVSWDNVQAMIDADYKSRKKHFAAMRAKEKRNKPPTKAQKRNTMSTYLKNMVG